ncbi:TPA: Sua5/YciO/YrdC/YwlC family protein [Staphylococcus aureus]|nr:L-threonylcarbamoyladenylate synthase [Staphylococcus aureus]
MEILNDSVKSFEKLYLQLQDGFPVIVPTDTNYNLCSLPNNDLCIDKIFEYKKRSKDKPLSLFIDKPEDWKLYGDNQNTEIVDKLVEIFWPGPLNIILKNKTSYNYMLNNSDSIAIGCVQNKTNYKTSSTIIKVTDNKIELLREGDIKFEEIKERLGTGIIYE